MKQTKRSAPQIDPPRESDHPLEGPHPTDWGPVSVPGARFRHGRPHFV